MPGFLNKGKKGAKEDGAEAGKGEKCAHANCDKPAVQGKTKCETCNKHYCALHSEPDTHGCGKSKSANETHTADGEEGKT